MKHIVSYFAVCCKRAAKSYLSIFVMTVLLVAALAVAGKALIGSDADNGESKMRVKVGVVGDLSQTYLGIGFDAIKELDSVSISIDFVETDLESAKKAVENAKMAAYIIVPDNYVEDMLNGKDTMLEFVLPQSSAAASGVLVSEVVKLVSPIVTQSERGIYAMHDYRKSMDIPYSSAVSNVMKIEYLKAVLSREYSIDLVLLDKPSLSIEEYYISGISVFFILVFATACCVLFADKKLPLGRLLCSKNLKSYQLVLCEYITFNLLVLTTILILSLAGEAALKVFSSGTQTGLILKALLCHLPHILVITSVQFFIYEASGNIITGVLAQFLFACAGGYISGCFYPYYFFPQSVQSLSSKLPSGLLFESVRDYLLCNEGKNNAVICLLYIGVFLGLSCVIRRYRLKKENA